MKFDVFLSHNSKDKPVVEQLAHRLEAKGLKVWLDMWNLIPGDPWQEDLEDALDESQTIAVFVGPHHISPWENEEMRSAIEQRVQDKSRRVIPVLLPGAPDNTKLKLPRFLKRLTWVDMRAGIDNEAAFYRLECGIKGTSPGKPTRSNPIEPPDGELPPVGDLSIGSYLPFPPNPLFEGRVPDLKKIADSLLRNSGSGVVVNQAITGMGGLGKTQLAVEFAYRYGSYFRGVHWLNLADPSQLDAEIARCGLEMTLANWPEDQPSQVALTLNTWKADGPRLLVLDNFEAVEEVNNVLPRLRHSNLRLLTTSRRSDWTPASGLRSLPLDVFSPDEGIAFFRNALKKRSDSHADLKTLGERLGFLPLALELAGRYLNGHPRLGVADYLTQAKQAFDHPSMRDWRKDLPAPTQHDLDLQHTFALSWQVVKDELTQRIFRMAGSLAPNTPIPPQIFEKALQISSETCDEALTILYGLGLMRRSENDQPTIHPLLAEYVRGLEKEDTRVLQSLANTVVTLSNEILETGLPSEFLPIKPHMPFLALHAESGKLESAGELWNNYAYYLKVIADYDNARLAFERARQIDEVTLGPDHLNVAIRINNLGLVLWDQGDFDGARLAFEHALKITEAALGPDHPKVAIRLNNVGTAMQRQGDLTGARTAIERALKIDEAAFGPNHPDVAIRLSNLGNVMKELGDLDRAQTLFKQALEIDKVVFGPDHPNVAIRLKNLGEVMHRQGDLNGAHAMYEHALTIFKKFLPPDHPNIKFVQGNLDSLKES